MQRERPLIHETSNGGRVSEWDVIVIPSSPFPCIRIRHLKTAKGEEDERPSGFSVWSWATFNVTWRGQCRFMCLYRYPWVNREREWIWRGKEKKKKRKKKEGCKNSMENTS